SMVEKWPELREALRESESSKVVAIKVSGRIVLLRPAEIEVVRAHRTYATIHTAGGTHLVRSSLSALHEKLPEGKFIRINRSTLINAARVQEVVRRTHGDGRVRLDNGRE